MNNFIHINDIKSLILIRKLTYRLEHQTKIELELESRVTAITVQPKSKSLVQTPLSKDDTIPDFPKIEIPYNENWDDLKYQEPSPDTSQTEELKFENLCLVGNTSNLDEMILETKDKDS